ncbi:O-antigen ligase [Iodobacter sp.]|uniref:O-antigen ligase family protein n=1 Tax=Iodobacter sp. TaxID=1915058 RepID=UPI0025D179F1|nr:O-antigen ligase family protein [Iodobacter sp.]
MKIVGKNGFVNSEGNFWILPLYLIAAGLDFRLSDIGVRGPNVNLLEFVTILGLGKILLDALVLPKQFSFMLNQLWKLMPVLVLYYSWIFVASLIGLLVYPKSIFIVRNLFPAFVFSLFLVNCVRTPKQLRILMYFFLISSLPNVLLGALQYLMGKPYLVVLNMASAVKMDLDGSFVRNVAAGLYSHPNGLSIFLLPVVVISAALSGMNLGQGVWGRVMALLLFIISAVVLYGTRAKGAWLWSVFGLSLLLFPLWFYRIRNSSLLFVSILVSFIIGITLFSLDAGKTLSTMWTRVFLWNAALNVFSHDIFLSFFGSAQLKMWYVSAKLADVQYDNAHNTFLNQMVNFGFFGLFFYLLNMLVSIKKACEIFYDKNAKDFFCFSKIAIAITLAISGQYFFEPAAESSGYALTFVFFIAIPSLLQNMREGANEL